MLFFQTFIQQSLQTESRRVLHKDNNATIKRAVVYFELAAKTYNVVDESRFKDSGWLAPYGNLPRFMRMWPSFQKSCQTLMS